MSIQRKIVMYTRVPLDAFIKIMRMNAKIKTGVIILLVLGIVVVLEPFINDYRLNGELPITAGLFKRNRPPSLELPMGTDVFGRDLFGMTLMGLRYTLLIGFSAGGVGIIVAIAIGSFAGYRGGLIDFIITSVADFMMVIPTWPILILISAYLPRIDVLGLSLIIAAFGWSRPTRALRAQILSLKERSYIELAKVSGLRDLEIIFKEILPNVLPYVGVGFASASLSAMAAETGIRFLGIGPATIPTLGYLINFLLTGLGAGILTTRPLVLIPPILLLILAFVSLNLINVGLDEAYNPRLKKVTGM